MTAYANIKEFLTAYHDSVMDCEQRALAAGQAGDSDTWRTLMKEKAEKMAAILTAAEPWLKQEDPSTAAMVTDRLKSFAASAKLGLRLDSPFYWSALLWNDDSKPGDPDNLQLFIEAL